MVKRDGVYAKFPNLSLLVKILFKSEGKIIVHYSSKKTVFIVV
jgi:hypothetical protein